MPSNKTSSRDETDYLHFSAGATGLHHLHGHRPALLSERSSGALALDLPPSRAWSARGGGAKVDSASRSQVRLRVCGSPTGARIKGRDGRR
jgi:hypothetical protein